MKRASIFALAAVTLAALVFAQGQRKGSPTNPARDTSATIAGKRIAISYSAPSVRGRKIFGDGGVVSHDGTYPVWRAGADEATMLHTDATLEFRGLTVPPGDYTVWVQVDKAPWQLIINKQTGQWGTDYDKSKDLGRVTMTNTKPAAPVETMKMNLASEGGNRGKLTIEWADVSASAPFTVK